MTTPGKLYATCAGVALLALVLAAALAWPESHGRPVRVPSRLELDEPPPATQR